MRDCVVYSMNSPRFYFDFSATYVGVGMICPYIVNVSLLLGAILSWGLMWPLINNQKGHWYSADIPPSSLHSLQGYRVRSQLGAINLLTSLLFIVASIDAGVLSRRLDSWRWPLQHPQGPASNYILVCFRCAETPNELSSHLGRWPCCNESGSFVRRQEANRDVR